jgi:uncharacterized protein (TIGR03083 family)
VNDTAHLALTETTRDELRERIGLARDRFDRLIRTADPLARPPGMDWTVQQVGAHVLSVAHRYRQVARGLGYRRAVDPADMRVINQEEMEAVMAPVPDIADQLRALEAEMDAACDRLHDDPQEFPFHMGVMVNCAQGEANWIGELLVHGLDIARAVNVPWQISERDALLILSNAIPRCHAFVRRGLSPDVDICVGFKIPAAPHFVIHVHGGTAEVRPYRPSDCPDAVFRAPASTVVTMLYGRIGPWAAVRQGLRVGGRRPWEALRFQSCFETG